MTAGSGDATTSSTGSATGGAVPQGRAAASASSVGQARGVAVDVPTPLTDRLEAGLPDAFRDADNTDPRRPLRRYLEVALGDGDALEVLLDRLGTDLADPRRADAAWLPWLAQLVGLTLPADATEQTRRDLLSSRAGGYLTGTRSAIVAAARAALTGTRSATVQPVLNGDEFLVGLRTLGSETPSTDAVLDAIERAGARPAGYDVEVTFYAASWDTLEAAYPTSAAWDAVPSWAQLEETGAGTPAAPQTGRRYGEGRYGEGVFG